MECRGALTPVTPVATCHDNCQGCTAGCGDNALPLGTSTVSCHAHDAAGNTASCNTQVTVVDKRAPELSLAASPAVLWPPHHQMVPITLTRQVDDACDGSPAVLCGASSNEPDGCAGDDKCSGGDIQWIGGQLFLRAERSWHGKGRIYTISCTARDVSGNVAQRSTEVMVPLDVPK
jgi:hypothetical protein